MSYLVKKCALVLCVLLPSWVLADTGTITVGIVPQFEQRQMFKNWKPILIELEKITGLKFELIGSSKIPAFEKQFNQGAYDMAYMNPYHALKAYESQKYIPLVRDSRKLKGILVVNSDSTINTIKQLENKTIAFPSPNALGASLLMRSILKEKFGLIFKSRYVQTHNSVYLHVAKNIVDAGGGIGQTLIHQPDALQKKLRIIFETQEIISHPIVIHPRVSKAKRQLIKKGLIELFRKEKGKALFRNVPINDLVSTNINDYKSLLKLNLDRYFE